MTDLATKTSPKVLAAQAWSFLAPVLLAAVVALVSFLLTEDGRALFRELPIYVQIPLFAFVSALGARIAGYKKTDPIRQIGLDAIAEGQDKLPTIEVPQEAYDPEDPELDEVIEDDHQPRRALDADEDGLPDIADHYPVPEYPGRGVVGSDELRGA